MARGNDSMISNSFMKKPSTLFLSQKTRSKQIIGSKKGSKPPSAMRLSKGKKKSTDSKFLQSPTNKAKIQKNIKTIKKQPKKNHFKKKKSPFNKFLEKSDIIEIALRAPTVSDEEEMELITLLYEHLATPTNEIVNLYKLLIYYEQIQTFELLLDYRIKHNFSKDKGRKMLEEMEEYTMGRKDDDNIYDFDEIISDAFAYAIRLNKLHIAFYLFNKYEDDVYGNKFLCIKAIFESFKNDDTQVNHVMYLEERLFILEKFMKHIEYKMSLEFLTTMHLQVLDDPKDNFLVYCSNPLKIIVILLNITISISKKHQNLVFKAQKFRSTL
jgi:hypothetical protein